MDNIEFLLQSLNSETDENNDAGSNHETYSGESFENKTENTTLDSSSSQKHDMPLNVADSVFKNDYDFEITKKQLSSKYSVSGNEIRKKLKENERSRYEFDDSKQPSWSSKRSQESSRELAVSNSAVKHDVYAEPVFGLRLINPIVSSSCITTKMAGRLPISVSNISNHLRCGDKSKDWVFAGAVVFKSGLKTSQKGSQYCLWKISDLKHDLQQITLYLFGKACSDLWKVSLGTVAAVLNATPFYKDEKPNHDEVTLTIKSADQVMILGGSRDYGLCKALKKNGEKCTSFVNKNACEFCIFHVKKEYNKYAGTRSNLQAPSIGLTNLRNKVLGKSEVFYAGKSYSAVNVPKQRKTDQKYPLAQKSVMSTVSKKIRESDQLKLEKLSSSKNQCIDRVSAPENFLKESVPVEKLDLSKGNDVNQSKKLPILNESIRPSKSENSHSASSTKSSLGKPVLSRLHLFKQAGAKMVESGQGIRISAAAKTKKTPCFSFADVLNGECPSPEYSQVDNIKENESKEKKVALNKKDSVIDLSVDVKKSLNRNSPSTMFNTCKVLPSKKITSTANSKNKSKTATEYLGPSKILQDFKNIAGNSGKDEHINQQNSGEDVRIPKFVESPHEKQNLSSPKQTHNGTTDVKSFMSHLPSQSASIHDMKKARAKQNAISLIKRQGGITKVNPNQVRPEPNQRKSIKRPAENSDTEDNEESVEKSVLSQRFVDLMNATSRHENLVEIAEDIERQDYFNKMEKKEQLEEKMLSTYKVPCKAVICLKCKYKWFSASDLCRAEGHPIKVIDTVKRYFKCDNCTNRTVSLEVVPLVSCKQCGSSKWSRAGMIKEKLARNDNALSIRGDEIKHLDSLSHSMNINLLVPDDK